MKGSFEITMILLMLVSLILIYWGIATSDLPEWFKFALLR